MRAFNNTDSITSNNTFLNVVKILYILNLLNISMMLCKSIIQRYWVGVTIKSHLLNWLKLLKFCCKMCETRWVGGWMDVLQLNGLFTAMKSQTELYSFNSFVVLLCSLPVGSFLLKCFCLSNEMRLQLKTVCDWSEE